MSRPVKSCAVHPEAAELGRRFRRFRAGHVGGRIPDELRAAAIGLLSRVPPEDVYRACGVTFRQVVAWRAARRCEDPSVRIFNVEEEDARPRSKQPPSPAEHAALELRIGPWTVHIRLAPPGDGGSTCSG